MNDFFNNIDAGIDEFSEQKAESVLKALESLPDTIDEKAISDVDIEDTERNKDTRFAAEQLKNACRIADVAARQVFQLAASSDQPRAWEVLSAILKTNVDSAKALSDMSAKQEKPTKGDAPKAIESQTNIFIGSTEDLFDMMEEYHAQNLKVINAD